MDVTYLPEYKRARYIGRVFQDPMMGTAADHADRGKSGAGRRGAARLAVCGPASPPPSGKNTSELLKGLNLGLEDRMTTKVGLLSGGQRQALTLLMATLQKPKLLLLDEHTAALDPKTAAKVLEADGAHRSAGAADHADDHPQYAGRHRPRQPAHHAL